MTESELDKTTDTELAEQDEPGQPAPVRVLVAEDEALIRLDLTEMLQGDRARRHRRSEQLVVRRRSTSPASRVRTSSSST